MPTPTYLTSRQAAEQIGCSVSKISRLVAAERLTPVMKLDGLRGAMWFDPDDVAAYVAESNPDGDAA